MFEKAKAINELRKIQSALAKEIIKIETGNGAVKVTINGAQEIKKVTLDEAIVREADIAKLEKWIESGVSQAITKSQQLAAEKMKAISGGLGIPGL
ncbi:YbaB/EbfC family nucleoid-associated protein [Candidatus Saccharibacteria bacterium]|nr:YbaB/EbfC family nucleoid-associated protein [Candidatus Saccharibacteria bacterium]